MKLSLREGYGSVYLEGTDKALVTAMRVVRAIESRGFGFMLPAKEVGSKTQIVWPGVGRVELERVDDHTFSVKFISGAWATRFEHLFARV